MKNFRGVRRVRGVVERDGGWATSLRSLTNTQSDLCARSAKRERCNASPTLQLASRQAGCVTRPAFRHPESRLMNAARARLFHSCLASDELV